MSDIEWQSEEGNIVNHFSDLMLEKIIKRRNRYAPMGWMTLDVKRVLSLLEGELWELKEAMGPSFSKAELARKREEIADECVDVANYAMFLHNIIKHQKQ